jgi:hypothetical protein
LEAETEVRITAKNFECTVWMKITLGDKNRSENIRKEL